MRLMRLSLEILQKMDSSGVDKARTVVHREMQ
jgi:hypothetical protein